MLRYLPFAALALALFLSACGGDGDGTVSPTEPSSSPEATTAASPDASPGGMSFLTPDATEQPIPQLTPVPLAIESVTSPIAQVEEANVTAQTTPDTPCSIVLVRSTRDDPDYVGTALPFEVMQLPGLESTVSDESGLVSWNWELEPDTAAAEWRIIVVCGQGGGTSTAYSVLEVVEQQ